MFSNISITRECRKNLINLKGRRYNEVTDLSEDELARYLKIDNDLFKFYTNWYVFDDGLYYFKSDFVFNEIFLSELAREFNVKCVKFMLATDGHHIGVLSKNFIKKTSTYLDYLECTRRYFAYIPEDLDTFKNQSYGVFGEDIGKRLTDQVFSLVAFDFFSGQNDRTHINVAFETNGSEVAKLAPLCDNGVSFSTSDFNSYISCFGNLYFPFDKYIDPRQLELLKLVRNNISFYNSLAKALDIDIQEILNRTIEKYKFKMSTQEKIKINDYFGAKKDVIERTLKYSSKI